MIIFTTAFFTCISSSCSCISGVVWGSLDLISLSLDRLSEFIVLVFTVISCHLLSFSVLSLSERETASSSLRDENINVLVSFAANCTSSGREVEGKMIMERASGKKSTEFMLCVFFNFIALFGFWSHFLLLSRRVCERDRAD